MKMKTNIYKVFIRSAFDGFEKYYFIGTKEQLMTLIGIIYSTRIVQIERISYQKIVDEPEDIDQIKYIVDEPEDIDQIKYIVDDFGNLGTYKCGRGKHEQIL